MSRFASYDGTEIAFRTLGDGRPLVCLPGGPGRAGEYLGDLGGLAGSRQLILPDTRGTGASANAADPGTYRCDRLVQDVEALRVHLGLASMDLLGHSAAGELGGDSPAVILYVQVRDLRASLVRARELGGALVTEPFDVPNGPTMATIGDPEGNPLVLVQQ
jgi:hypothetical protein